MKNKRIILPLALGASMLTTANIFAQTPCSSGVTIQFNGVGSSSQANSLAQAARALTQSGSSYNLVSTSKGAVVTDTRPATAVTDTANPFWVTLTGRLTPASA
jgi:hypothetical protein